MAVYMDLQDKIITIFGMGRSGVAAMHVCVKLGAKLILINSGTPCSWSNIKEIEKCVSLDKCFEEGEKAQEHILNSDIIILSPGISRKHNLLSKIDNRIPIWSEIELAYRVLPKKRIIGITGTNGKTTTVSMLGEIFKYSGLNVFVGGNIGIPFCEAYLSKQDYDIYLLELSSFQLESIELFKANISVILNISHNHGERYDAVKDYGEAKFQITKGQDHEDISFVAKELLKDYVNLGNARLVEVDLDDYDFIYQKLKSQFELSNYKLVGRHNIINLYFIYKICEVLKIKNKFIQQAIDTFCGVDFRLQFISSNNDFRSYNDAKSTNWHATISAVNSLMDIEKDIWLVLGGQKRGRNDSILPVLDKLRNKVTKILLIGETAPMLYGEINDKISVEKFDTVDDVFKYVRNKNFSGAVLFSPAFPSFDQFKNYIDRGHYVNKLIKKN